MNSVLAKEELSFVEVVTALLIGSAALLVLGLQPILLGELLEAKQVSLEGIGLVAMAEIIALGAGVLLGEIGQPTTRLRSMTVVAATAAVALDLLTLRASGDLGFALVRGAAGLAEGMLLWVATAVIVRSPHPARVAGIFFVVQTAAQATLGLVLARIIIPASGWQGAFIAVAVATMLSALIAWQLPRTVHALATSSQAGFRWSPHTAMPLVVAFLQLSALGSLWAYVEPLGKAAGFDAKDAQTLITAALGMQIIGGCIGSAMVRRLAALPALASGSAVLGLVALAMPRTPGAATLLFAALCAIFAFTWLFLMPFQMGMAFSADGSGRVASLIPAAQLFGIAFGPLMASVVVEGEQAGAVPLVSATFATTATLVLLLTLTFRRTKTAAI